MDNNIENLYYATCRVSSNILKDYYKKNNITLDPQPEYYEYLTIVYKNNNDEFINVYSDNTWDKYLERLNIHDNNYQRYNRKCLDISDIIIKIYLEDNIDYIVEKHPVLEIKRNMNPNTTGASERMFDYWIDDYIKFKDNSINDDVSDLEENVKTITDMSKRKYITLERNQRTAKNN